ncbi:hypothetical protein Ddye_003846 [Dipteronia dyeriana]|uniref:BZIP domain-containing protein n=1 Tax=Dipteronia dyeriana TaxID=168575 RepID=A0AAD9XTL1_9ROSI|nr:hypothetical protein Ddye_003846 [Dipteronia dyeriana]
MSFVNASGSGKIVNAASDFRTDADNASQNEGSTGESDVIDEDFSATKKQRTNRMLAYGAVGQNNFTVQHIGRNSDLVLLDSSEHMGLFPTASVSRSPTGAALIKDESELRKERKRQSNRESAKRAKLYKQEEVKHLRAMVKKLKAESSMLKNDLLSLCNECGKLKDENDSLVEELKQIYGEDTDAISSLEALISDTSEW